MIRSLPYIILHHFHKINPTLSFEESLAPLSFGESLAKTLQYWVGSAAFFRRKLGKELAILSLCCCFLSVKAWQRTCNIEFVLPLSFGESLAKTLQYCGCNIPACNSTSINHINSFAKKAGFQGARLPDIVFRKNNISVNRMNDFAKRQVSKGAFSPWSFVRERSRRGDESKLPLSLCLLCFTFLAQESNEKKKI